MRERSGDTCRFLRLDRISGGGPKAEKYARYITRTPTFEIITPSLVVFEVYRKVKKERGEEKAMEAQDGRV